MSESPALPETRNKTEHVFPVLTPAQIARIAPLGRVRPIQAGEVLLEAGEQADHFFVILSGRLDILRTTDGTESLVVSHGPGMFSGDVNMLSGRPTLVRMRAGETGEVIELDREHLMSLVQTDNELGEILMRAFILRRVELIARGVGGVILIGSTHTQGTLRIKEFLTRNGHPYNYIDLDTDSDVQTLLDRFHVSVDDVPVLICRGEFVLRNPSNEKIADCLGFNDAIDEVHQRDVVIVGAGPAGLAAAVYGASEGLDVLVIESNAPGGQAGASSKIENYLGFPTGISGQELAGRAYTQAQKFGAQVMIARGAKELSCSRRPFAILLENGSRVPARTVIIATGADYRRLAIDNLARFEGAGIYYGATFVESQACAAETVAIVGGGNSAGQAAVFLAEHAQRVFIFVRREGLDETMSRYLIRRIEQNPRIELRTRTEVVALEGEDHLERIRCRDHAEKAETLNIRHLFVMTGAVPSTKWLDGCVTLDEKGFIRTGPDLTPEHLAAAGWPLKRAPYLLETSLPGVFAVGDVRSGNVKRVASAVGEGSIAISFVHRVLHE
ncbi:MAG: thioredoxin reductase [Thermoanaerobaculia bacterium]|jgi:thioredoxin reductase (NADPH)|nr:thioredoxin reductase [Thermoanaerobaculia bacterium]